MQLLAVFCELYSIFFHPLIRMRGGSSLKNVRISRYFADIIPEEHQSFDANFLFLEILY